ncbi:MAG: hypothetical protein ABIS07_02170 [Dokdonella sp.]
MFMPIRFAPTLLASALLSLACGVRIAAAVCTPGDSYIRYVGDTATDAECTDNDIQSAINNTQCPNTTIVITPEHTYTAQHLDIGGKSLTLKGTANACGLFFEPPPPTAPLITISGAGHSGDSVLYIHGASNVTLQYLKIRDGSNASGHGGGIHFDGNGSLTLDTTTVDHNTAMYGGGIDFNGSGGFAGLALLGYSLVINNTAANSGGGIRAGGDSYLSLLYDNTLIAFNHAPDGYGGGLNVVGPARADVASPGLGSLGVVYSNDALHGGGMAVTAGSSSGQDAYVHLFTVDPARPVRVHQNFASESGGGIYAKGYQGFPALNNATVCAFDFRIDDNGAPDGSAIHADYDTDGIADEGSDIHFNRSIFDGSDCRLGLPSFARRCAAGVPCNTINGNAADDANGNPTLGATIRISRSSELTGDRFVMQGNEGGYAIRSDDWPARVSNCLLTDNNVTRQLLNADSGLLEINNCTIANNAILSTDTIHAEGALTLDNSIIDQPGNLALAYSGAASDLHVDYVLSSDVTTLPPVEGVALGQPSFVDAAHGNYHLQLDSLGVDYAPAILGDDRDLDNFPHDQDVSSGDLWGVHDLGAYEQQHPCSHVDTVFCDGFENP